MEQAGVWAVDGPSRHSIGQIADGSPLPALGPLNLWSMLCVLCIVLHTIV